MLSCGPHNCFHPSLPLARVTPRVASSTRLDRKFLSSHSWSSYRAPGQQQDPEQQWSLQDQWSEPWGMAGSWTLGGGKASGTLGDGSYWRTGPGAGSRTAALAQANWVQNQGTLQHPTPLLPKPVTASHNLLNSSSELEQNFVRFTLLLPRKPQSGNRDTGKTMFHWVTCRRFSSHKIKYFYNSSLHSMQLLLSLAPQSLFKPYRLLNFYSFCKVRYCSVFLLVSYKFKTTFCLSKEQYIFESVTLLLYLITW